MKNKYVKWLVGLLLVSLVVSSLSKLSFGDSDVVVTLTAYLMLGLFCRAVFNRWKVAEPVVVIVFATLFGFFIAEMGLRYGVKRHLTYMEKNGAGYGSPYDYGQKRNRWLNEQYDEDDSSKGRLFRMPINELRNYTQAEFSYPAERTNRLGLRGPLPAAQKQVIAALGDSFTESWGAPADSTYPAIWQQLLPTPDSIAVLNAGVSGSDPFYAFNLLQELTKSYTLSGAVFMINLSDLNDYIWRGGSERFLPDGGIKFRNGPWWEPVYAFSMVFRLIAHDVCGLGWSLMRADEEQKVKQEAATAMAKYVEQVVVPWCVERQITPVVVLQPFSADLKKPSADYLLLQQAFVQVKSPVVYDMLPDAQKWPEPQKMYWPLDGHFTPLGYAAA
jgi:hypothetical protein